MEIRFTSRKIQKAFSSTKDMISKWGPKNAEKIQQRLMELLGAETLKDMSYWPSARCHELKGDRAGQLSVDLKHPFRLLFVPDHYPAPVKEDGGLDWTRITQILIIEVVDTHQ